MTVLLQLDDQWRESTSIYPGYWYIKMRRFGLGAEAFNFVVNTVFLSLTYKPGNQQE